MTIQSVSTKMLDHQPLYIVGERQPLPSSKWTPRAELRSWISRKIHQWPSEVALMVRAAAAVLSGDATRCNLALDEVLLHEEREPGRC
jgi:hypothetical protein